MTMKNVLLTGATGFVGRFVARRLAGQGYRVRAVSRRPDAGVPGAAEVVALPDDPASKEVWLPLLAGIDHVVHCAGIAHATGAIARETYFAANAALTGALAEAAFKATSGRFIFLSSIRAVTGATHDGTVTDETPPQPQNDYGRSKLEGERRVAETFGDSGRFAILRPVLIYGPQSKGNLAALARLAALPVPLPIAGLKAPRSLLDVASLADAILFLLERPQIAPGPFLVCDRNAIGVADIVSALRNGRGRRPSLFSLPDALLSAPLRLAGRGEDWHRLTGPFVAYAEGLEALGWQPAEDTAARIAAYARAERKDPA
jgi:UDP-glucose 4-epimerase